MTDQITPTTRRVAAYIRVSTTRQAEADLSVPDQIRAAEAWCAARGASIVTMFVEAGASGLDEDRPEFQRMLEMATAPGHPFDLVLVHSLSRFSRDTLHAELAIRRLRKAGVEVASVTQEISGDGTGEVVRKMLSVFDEYSSRENAKHTRRAMVENARQGFWNGSTPPFGYRTEEAGRKGARIKKVLVVHEPEATLVRRIFAAYAGEQGIQRGVKATAAMLNARVTCPALVVRDEC
ncbi:MAG: recombinase family protein [Acetobacteraceae bacterium]|jgi:DNA invertase Pin-like site-specific DNA recombinase|nr:recombinase family protein [Acetobacteraceae bacterium]